MSYNNAVELTKKLVQIDSTNPGTFEAEMHKFVRSILPQENVEFQTSEVLPGRSNLMATIKGEIDSPSFVYICHMDTVVIGNDWTYNPFGADEKDGKIYGRGSCDMKSGMACAICAFCSVANAKTRPKHTFKLILTVDEEDFMRGVEKVISDKWVTKDDWIMDTEPTNSMIQVAHKGRTWFEIDVFGITAHASTPWKGADANAALAEIISFIRREIAKAPKHDDLGISTVTFGMMEGGYRPYVVPDKAKVWIDMRLVPPTDTKRATEIVEMAIEHAKKEIPNVDAKYTITGDRPYIEKDPDSLLLKNLKIAADEVTGVNTVISYFPGYTDTAVIAGKTGNRNCMSYGPGNLEMAHKPDEWVEINDIVRCQKVLEKLAFLMVNQ